MRLLLYLWLLAGLLAACTPTSQPAPLAVPTVAAGPTEVLRPAAAPPASPASAPTLAAAVPSQLAAPASGELTVFAAASLTDAFKEVGAAFEAANPGSKVAFNFGASTQLRTQLEQG